MWLTEAGRPRKFWRGKMRQPTFFTPDKIFRDGGQFGRNDCKEWSRLMAVYFSRILGGTKF